MHPGDLEEPTQGRWTSRGAAALRSSATLLAYVLPSLLGAGCSSSDDSSKFGPVYTQVISTQCLPCHATGFGAMQGKLDMSTQDSAYANLVGVDATGVSCGMSGLKRVVAGDPASSLMYLKVNAKTNGGSPPCGDSMPDDMNVLTQAQVDMIHDWISEGANP